MSALPSVPVARSRLQWPVLAAGLMACTLLSAAIPAAESRLAQGEIDRPLSVPDVARYRQIFELQQARPMGGRGSAGRRARKRNPDRARARPALPASAEISIELSRAGRLAGAVRRPAGGGEDLPAGHEAQAARRCPPTKAGRGGGNQASRRPRWDRRRLPVDETPDACPEAQGPRPEDADPVERGPLFPQQDGAVAAAPPPCGAVRRVRAGRGLHPACRGLALLRPRRKGARHRRSDRRALGQRDPAGAMDGRPGFLAAGPFRQGGIALRAACQIRPGVGLEQGRRRLLGGTVPQRAVRQARGQTLAQGRG